MNIGYEDDELRPFAEPEADYADQLRVATLTNLGYSREEIEESLRAKKYDDVMANYLLLIKKQTENSDLSTFSSSSLDVLINGVSLNGGGGGGSGQAGGSAGVGVMAGGVLQSPGHVKVQRSISAAAKPRRFSHGGHAIAGAPGTTGATGAAAPVGTNVTTGGDATVITNNQALASAASTKRYTGSKAKEERTSNGSANEHNGSPATTNGPIGLSKQGSVKVTGGSSATGTGEQSSGGSAQLMYGGSGATGKLPALGSLRQKSAATSPGMAKGAQGPFSAIPRRNTYNYNEKSAAEKAALIHASNSSNASNTPSTANSNGSSEHTTTPTKCVFN